MTWTNNPAPRRLPPNLQGMPADYDVVINNVGTIIITPDRPHIMDKWALAHPIHPTPQ